MEEKDTVIQKRIKYLLEKNNFSQRQLAEQSKLTQSTISQIINGGKMTIKSALKIAKVFNTSIDFLFGISDIESPNEYALKVLLNHIHSLTTKSFWNDSPIVSSISISKEFAKYLETTINIESMQMPTDLRDEWLKREQKSFVLTLENEPTRKREYVLINHNFYTEEVANLIEKIKREMQGNIHEPQEPTSE